MGDGRNLDEMEAVVKHTRVVLTTAGPFSLYGTALVEACAKHGVDYVDLTGARTASGHYNDGVTL